MPVQVTVDQITQLAPNIRSVYRDGFANGQSVLDLFGISQNDLRVAHFMAQMLHETGGLSILIESLNYSEQGLVKTWPSRFQPKGPLDPAQYAHNEQKIANEVYGNRMGNTAPGDGFTYRGRGLLQLTGKDSYAQATKILLESYPDTPDFAANPEAVITSDWCVKVAAAEWAAKGCNGMADQDNVRAVTYAINGGYIGLAQRTEWLAKTKFIWK
ncbi:MAG TPA: lytic enzyme [Candidatus Bathyarchaeia archaeon]|nr:lytic enzyme [Candidatus Bathyarchaeia archaeon]